MVLVELDDDGSPVGIAVRRTLGGRRTRIERSARQRNTMAAPFGWELFDAEGDRVGVGSDASQAIAWVAGAKVPR